MPACFGSSKNVKDLTIEGHPRLEAPPKIQGHAVGSEVGMKEVQFADRVWCRGGRIVGEATSAFAANGERPAHEEEESEAEEEESPKKVKTGPPR